MLNKEGKSFLPTIASQSGQTLVESIEGVNMFVLLNRNELLSNDRMGMTV
ncbi:MAG: hypothetical protein ACRBC3_03950 [Burkholderiaceae bacterium]